ncbi:hypothetical protein BJY04DRAFT_187530 [Aspergillus karnatakaensis]|uniref:putative MATH and UCH domain protein n=1 Tax=Aspergillus karnatakaensis TaxID=1810916 RepID=UPI003CCDAA8F
MDSRVDTAVTVEQLPVPIPLDTDSRLADPTTSPAPTVNATVQETSPSHTQPPAIDSSPSEPEPQQESTPATTEASQAADTTQETEAPIETESPQETEAPRVTEATQQEAAAPREAEPTLEAESTPAQEAENPAEPEASREPETTQETENQEAPADSDSAPQENSENSENAEEHAYWVEEEEDTSVPDEDEMKEIESQAEGDYSALEYKYWEKSFYPVLDDPEYHPTEKARLTWKIKGVRGTKESPNRVKIMRSPPAYVGGYWWTIKFFPRGNNVTSLSVYIECSSTMPKPDESYPETEFKVLRGPSDTELDTSKPDLDFKFDKTEDTEAWVENFKSQYPAAANQAEPTTETWRVSAQIGVIVYNPSEPRTGWMQSSCHQFNPHNLDWGWTNFHGPWEQIHRRQRGQRQALLRDDTLAFDAYIRIFDDPTKSLWWHPSDTEPTWDSLGLTGYRPLGDSIINHSADVAGLASLLHVAPFCKIIQSVDVLEHLSNCDVKPKPLCDALQKFLWQLRQRDQSLQYVDTDTITFTLSNLLEGSSDVCEFWERLRRSLEIELAGTPAAKELAQLFDSPSLDSLPAEIKRDDIQTLPKDYNSRVFVPADKAKTTSEAFNWYLSEKPGRWVLPPVLHLELGRQTLDKTARQWRLLYNRVDLDEEIDLSSRIVEGQSGKYVLYGYIVHRGRRTSGKFFSILRPGGPGTKWLAFDDGSDNRVECLTRKTALGPHLGLEADQTPDHKTGHDVAIAVMYIRSDVVKDFLPGPQGPWEVSEELREYYKTGQVSIPKKADGTAENDDVQVEVYSLQKYDQLSSLFDSYDLMSQAKAANSVMYLSIPRSTNLIEVRKKIGLWASTRTETEVSPENVRLWKIGHTRDRYPPTAALTRISDLTATLEESVSPVRYWLQIVSDGDAKYFAMKDPQTPVEVSSKPEEAVVERAASETSDDVQPPAPEVAEPSSSGTVGQDAANGEASVPTPVSVEQSITAGPNVEATEVAEPSQNEASAVSTPAEVASSDNVNAPAAIDGEQPHVPATTAAPTRDSNDTTPAAVVTDDSPSPETAALSTTDSTESTVQPPQSSTEEPAQAESPAAPTESMDSSIQPSQAPDVSSHRESPSDTPGAEEVVSAETEAVIAAIIAGDLQQLDEEAQQTAETQNQEPTPPATSEDQPQPAAEQADAVPEEATSQEPEVILPVEHVYYYIQLLDIESQSLRTVGSFFSQKEETIKTAIRKHLDWPVTKDFQVWQRIDATEVSTLASSETFEINAADGTCFIVGDKLNKEARVQLHKKGLFSSPDKIVRYLWALSRNHPRQAFTGTKTIDATFTSEYYSGEIMKGHYHGQGKHISDSAATYTGDWVLGKRHGKGLMEYPIGDTYDGDWDENQCHGQGTFVERKTGNKYVGGYKDGKRHGKGISYWEVADEEMDLCQICFGEEQDALFYDCGHVCACVTCARQVEICPICRKNILNVVKIYRT